MTIQRQTIVNHLWFDLAGLCLFWITIHKITTQLRCILWNPIKLFGIVVYWLWVKPYLSWIQTPRPSEQQTQTHLDRLIQRKLNCTGLRPIKTSGGPIQLHWPYLDHDNMPKPKSWTVIVLQRPKSGLNWHWGSFPLETQFKKPKFRCGVSQSSRIISKSWWKIKTPISNIQFF